MAEYAPTSQLPSAAHIPNRQNATDDDGQRVGLRHRLELRIIEPGFGDDRRIRYQIVICIKNLKVTEVCRVYKICLDASCSEKGSYLNIKEISKKKGGTEYHRYINGARSIRNQNGAFANG